MRIDEKSQNIYKKKHKSLIIYKNEFSSEGSFDISFPAFHFGGFSSVETSFFMLVIRIDDIVFRFHAKIAIKRNHGSLIRCNLNPAKRTAALLIWLFLSIGEFYF